MTIKPEVLQFCSGCGTLLPIAEELPLVGKEQQPGCGNCHMPVEKYPPIEGYFSPDAAAALRSLA